MQEEERRYGDISPLETARTRRRIVVFVFVFELWTSDGGDMSRLGVTGLGGRGV